MKKILQKLTSSCKQILPGIILGVITTSAFTFNALGQDIQAPTVPTGLKATCVTGIGLVLTWNKSTDNKGVKEYEVFKGGVSAGLVNAHDSAVKIKNLSPSAPYSFTVLARDTAGNASAQTAPLAITTPSGTSVAAGWSTMDIGSGMLPGSANFANNIFSLAGSGDDMIAPTDQFRYVYKTNKIHGPFTIIAHITSRNPIPFVHNSVGDVWNYAGLTARETLLPNSKGVSVVQTPLHGISWIVTPGSDHQPMDTIARPIWLKLTRVNDTVFRFYSSRSGTVWTKVDTTILKGVGDMYVGLAECAADKTDITFAQFENVTADESTPPTAPTGLTKSNVTNTGVTLTWTASTDNVAVTEYDVFQGQGTTPVAQVLEGLVSVDISGLSAGTTYSFTVKAKDAAGNFSAPSLAVSVTTTGTATGTPTVIASSVQVYPNPTSGGVDVQVNEHSTISILDVNGKLLVKKIIEKGTTRVPLNLKSGLYYVRIVGENNSVSTSKLMVE